jgi:hypothetical protein
MGVGGTPWCMLLSFPVFQTLLMDVFSFTDRRIGAVLANHKVTLLSCARAGLAFLPVNDFVAASVKVLFCLILLFMLLMLSLLNTADSRNCSG